LLFIHLQLFPKGALLLWLNAHYEPFFSWFFKYYTHLGDGAIFIPVVLVLVWVRLGYAALAAATGVVLAVVSNVLKHLVFPHALRPKAWYAAHELHLQWVEGVSIHSYNAFPSGHTATGAAVALLIALMAKRAWVTGICLLYALLVSLSRIYLAQHFEADVVYGFLEGLLVASLMNHFYHRLVSAETRNLRAA
jgi:membrane-associated phospholipid phosphatase